MISLNLYALQTKQADSDRLAAATAEFMATPGGTFVVVPPLPSQPLPTRRDWIDPETVLKRKPKGLNWAERQALRKMADAL